jgi:hypothetical protein
MKHRVTLLAPEGRTSIARGGAKRNPWNAAPQKPSALERRENDTPLTPGATSPSNADATPPVAELADEPRAPFVAPPRRDPPSYHAWLLGVSLAVLAAAALLDVRGGTQVVLPWLDVPLPELCYWKRYLGLDCPGCGLTRCFISMAHGDLASAWHYHPLGMALFAALVLHVPYRAGQWWRVRRGLAAWRLPGLAVATWTLIALFTAQWLWRLVAG